MSPAAPARSERFSELDRLIAAEVAAPAPWHNAAPKHLINLLKTACYPWSL